MSKRRAASVLMFSRNHGFRGHVPPMVVTLAGTGTVSSAGVMTILAASTGTWASWQAFLTVSQGTNIGTLVGTYQAADFPI